MDVAVTTSSRHAGLSCARRFAVARPRFSGRRSVFTVLSHHDCPGQPGLSIQYAGLQSSVVVLAWMDAVEMAKEEPTATTLNSNMTELKRSCSSLVVVLPAHLRWLVGVDYDVVLMWWCQCSLWRLRGWLRRPTSEAQILPRWGQAGPAPRVAWAAACPPVMEARPNRLSTATNTADTHTILTRCTLTV